MTRAKRALGRVLYAMGIVTCVEALQYSQGSPRTMFISLGMALICYGTCMIEGAA